MSLGHRFGIASLIVALLGVSFVYLWPDRKVIGWCSFAAAIVLGVLWLYLETKGRLLSAYVSSPGWTTILVGVAGGILIAFLFSLIASNLVASNKKVEFLSIEQAKPASSVILPGTTPESAIQLPLMLSTCLTLIVEGERGISILTRNAFGGGNLKSAAFVLTWPPQAMTFLEHTDFKKITADLEWDATSIPTSQKIRRLLAALKRLRDSGDFS